MSVASPALASTIDFSSTACAGSACAITGSVADGNLNLTAIGGNFGYKTHIGRTGLGVTDPSGDPTPGEIDVDESISGAFTLPGGVKIGGFELLFIYNGPEYQDP